MSKTFWSNLETKSSKSDSSAAIPIHNQRRHSLGLLFWTVAILGIAAVIALKLLS